MSDTVQRIQARARKLAGSGKFAGWRALAFELQFEPGFFEAYGWIYSPSTKRSSINCAKTRERVPSLTKLEWCCRRKWV